MKKEFKEEIMEETIFFAETADTNKLPFTK